MCSSQPVHSLLPVCPRCVCWVDDWLAVSAQPNSFVVKTLRFSFTDDSCQEQKASHWETFSTRGEKKSHRYPTVESWCKDNRVIVVTICSPLWEQNIINKHWCLSLSCTCIFYIVFHYHFFILYLWFYLSFCISHFLFHLSTYLLKGGFPTLFLMVQDGSYQVPTNILKLLPGLDRIRTAFRENVVQNTK